LRKPENGEKNWCSDNETDSRCNFIKKTDGVDLRDHILSMFHIMQQYNKAHTKIFFYIH
jgi:hypothetical protein